MTTTAQLKLNQTALDLRASITAIDPIAPSITDALGALAQQLEAGVGLDKSLDAAAPICKRLDAAQLFQLAAEQTRNGANFADILHTLSPAISYPERAILTAGWEGGRFDWAAQSVIERRRALLTARRKMRSGLMLPGITLLAASFIIPFIGFFQGSLSGTGYLFFAFTPPTIAIALYLTVRILQYRRARELNNLPPDSPPPPSTTFDRLLYRIPVFAHVERWRNLSEAAAILANMLSAGVGPIQALHTTARSLPNGVYRKQCQHAAQHLENGTPLYESLDRAVVVPAHWVTTLEVANTAGAEPEALEKLANEARERYLTAIRRASSFVTKAVYALVAMFVVYHIFKIFMGIAGVYQNFGL